MAERFDLVPFKATRTGEGYIVDSPVLTRTGIFEYKTADGNIRRELRHPDDVFSEDSLATLRAKPITVGHPGLVDAKNVKKHSVGTVLSKGRKDGDNLTADIVIHDTAAVDSGMKELSLGYQINLDETPGEWNGERYDARQKDIRLNHLAIVQRGRAGNARLNLDSADLIEEAAPLPDNTPVARLVNVRIDGLDYQASPEVERHISKLREDIADAIKDGDKRVSEERAKLDAEKARADVAEAARDQAKSEHEKLKANFDAAVAESRKAVQARMAIEERATKLGVEFKADQSDNDIRRAVIQKIRGDGVDLADKTDAYIVAYYDIATKEADRSDSASRDQRQQVSAPRTGSALADKVNFDNAVTREDLALAAFNAMQARHPRNQRKGA